jgi:hypothetical protein
MAYELNGVEYPSVTTITGILDKPALLSWASNCAVDYIQENLDAIKDPIDVHRGEGVLEEARKAYAQKRDDAGSQGTKVHKAIELYIHGQDYSEVLDNEESQTGFKAFLSWEEKNHVEWLETECAVYSQNVGYAGRFDAIAMVNGHRYLIDFKTSKGIYDEMKYQLCAYRQAYNEMLQEGQEKLENMAILHLDKLTGEPTFKPIEKDVERMTTLFNFLTMSYYLMANRRLKNNPFVARAKGEIETELPF